jgi:hypothetical protein
VAAYDWGGAGLNLTGGDHPEQVLGIHVTSGYFALFGAPVVADALSPQQKIAQMAVTLPY